MISSKYAFAVGFLHLAGGRAASTLMQKTRPLCTAGGTRKWGVSVTHVCSAHPSACTVKLSYGYSSPRPFNWTVVLVLVSKHGRRSDYTAFNIFSALPGRKTAGLAPFFILGQLLQRLCGVRPSQKDKSMVLQAFNGQKKIQNIPPITPNTNLQQEKNHCT